MEKSIRAVFEDECKALDIGPGLVKRLREYQQAFVNKNRDHIEFFGGHLTGVHVVRFTTEDRDRWFHEILETDEQGLDDRLIHVPAVNPEWNVSSDAMNLSCAWLLHALFKAPRLSPQQKEQAMLDVVLIWQYKYLTSRLYVHFPYPANRATAEAAYAMLNYKFDLKRYGNWAALLHARAEEFISTSGIHHEAITKMDNDILVIREVNDLQGRIRGIMKSLYGVFLEAHNSDKRIMSTSSVVEHDGEMVLRDKTKSLRSYTQYLNSVITDEGSFIRDELATTIEKMQHTMPPNLFRQTLSWMSQNYRQAGAGDVEKVVHDTLVHCFDYLADNRSLAKNHSDLPGLLGGLKGVYASSRSTDPTLIGLRERMEKLVKKATGNKNSTVIAAVRTGVLLYLVARALTMRHYSSSMT